jgi:catechol 2,3-dioxygenase-like lactoylglutathione lyase family enzyme
MPDEVTVPILPCADIDEMADFYRALGFEQKYRQTRPNPYVIVRRGGIELHFAAIPGFVPEDSYGSCIVAVDDTAAVFAAFAAGLRAAHGRLPLSGIPRLTRPRKRSNSGRSPGFSVIDPGGNWIRFFQRPAPQDPDGPTSPDTNAATASADTPARPDRPADAGGSAADADGGPTGAGGTGGRPDRSPGGALARALENAIVQGDSRGDHRQAARVLDGRLARGGDVPAAVLVEALVYRAELAARLDDPAHAAELLRRVRATPLAPDERERLAAALAAADDLEHDLPPEPPG